MTIHEADALAPAPPAAPPGRWLRFLGALRGEFGSPPGPGLALAGALARALPRGGWGRVRAGLYRAAGQAVGRGTLFFGPVTYGTAGRATRHVRFGAGCFVNAHVFIDAAAPVTMGDGVSLGHHVVIVTSDHAIGPPEFRAGDLRPRPVTIGDGAWIAASVTILPGVTVGPGAVVAAGAVVTGDVPPHALVGGVPARVIRTLPA